MDIYVCASLRLFFKLKHEFEEMSAKSKTKIKTKTSKKYGIFSKICTLGERERDNEKAQVKVGRESEGENTQADRAICE